MVLGHVDMQLLNSQHNGVEWYAHLMEDVSNELSLTEVERLEIVVSCPGLQQLSEALLHHLHLSRVARNESLCGREFGDGMTEMEHGTRVDLTGHTAPAQTNLRRVLVLAPCDCLPLLLHALH